MKPRSNLFDSIRVKSQQKKRAEATSAPTCQWDGCDRPGEHRAPVGRSAEGEYFRFCVDHVRQYNKGYNYFSGLSDGEIARYQKEAATGHRPTWKIGSLGSETSAAPEISSMRSGRAGYYSATGRRQPGRQGASVDYEKPLKPLEKKAIRTLGLEGRPDSEVIRVRYKLLVKQYHPDANQGDRGSEERFREVLDAYRLLKRSGFC
ncbi:molecular chaperone DnaJ [Notoacmeibacter marinus]|uniref:Molecular chaperone DnaJ n=1 Tax=Notoacmeibacter marinus TaxID=1876515 RepID=A0A231V3A4_9HYPH|nr:J domain-containing protein [Notoacmeibacter marinus]OXT02663.1 molecular chaperone DnaJ [Notoacmeibacter marinus]